MIFTPPSVIGHRGACQYAPENTLASLYKAIELGVTCIEFDVMLTKDGEAIIFHDETLNRTTNGTGLVADTTYAQIARLDAGSWFSPQFAGERIPTFTEYLIAASKHNLSINVEIKPTPGKEIATTEKVIEILQQHWPDTAMLPLISSFSIAALTHARELCDWPLGLLIDQWSDDWQSIVKKLDCISLNVLHTLLSVKKVTQIKSHVPYVLAYTVNKSIRAEKLFEMGVDGLFSNCPDLILPSPGILL